MSGKRMNKKTVKPVSKGHNATGVIIHTGKKTFIEPELKEYPSLKEVTLLTMPGVSGSTFFKTFK